MNQNRRSFLRRISAGAGAAAFGGLIPSSVLGANDRINYGLIGNGGIGGQHLRRLVNQADEYNCRVLAVSDVYRRRLNSGIKICGGDGYMDYRELLDRKDIDAVFICVPDHWHSKMAIEAMDAGKHVYLEKPISLTIPQALEVRDAVKRYNKVVQVGPQRTSEDKYWKAQEIIREGRIGKVTWARADFNHSKRGGLINSWGLVNEDSGPHYTDDDYIDWDMWLGHEWGLAPKIPWNPEHFYRFRKYWPYSGGVATDLIYHHVAPLLLAIVGNDGEYPLRANANGGMYVLKDGRDTPDVFMTNIDFPSEFTMNMVSVLTNDTNDPIKIYGLYGTIDLDDYEPRAIITPTGDFGAEFSARNGGKDIITIQSEPRPDMTQNFMDVIRKGGTLYCNVELATAAMVATRMAVLSYREKKTMRWDAANEKLLS